MMMSGNFNPATRVLSVMTLSTDRICGNGAPDETVLGDVPDERCRLLRDLRRQGPDDLPTLRPIGMSRRLVRRQLLWVLLRCAKFGDLVRKGHRHLGNHFGHLLFDTRAFCAAPKGSRGRLVCGTSGARESPLFGGGFQGHRRGLYFGIPGTRLAERGGSGSRVR